MRVKPPDIRPQEGKKSTIVCAAGHVSLAIGSENILPAVNLSGEVATRYKW
jgi:hypothetical protein